MLTELAGKGGRVCQQAREGAIHCPLIVRPTSEDVITGHLFGALEAINPRWWLADLLNAGLGGQHYSRQIYRRLRIHLWENQPRPDREVFPWKEGSTQVDAVIRWENPPTTVFIEMKFLSDVARHTTGSQASGVPGDQLIRNLRVGLAECGWIARPSLLNDAKRRFSLLLISPQADHQLVDKYSDPAQILVAAPGSTLPTTPWIGSLSYDQVAGIIEKNAKFMNRAERLLAQRLGEYLRAKSSQGQARNRTLERQAELRFSA